MTGPLLAVDAPFLLYRSFFALPQSITGVDDRPVGALLGACNVLLRAAAELRPRAIVLCFGAEAAQYRVALYPAYHAARPPVPPALAWQFEQSGFFASFGWQSLGSELLEADDLLGSLATIEQEAGARALILTGDRDMYQCAGPRTSILYLRSGKSGFETVDRDEVLRRYGIAPELVPDFIALRGDPSDGLPGAPGIGAKTAADLLVRHGSLEAAIAAADGERPRVAAALRQAAPELHAFKRIAQLQRVALERPVDGPTDIAGGAAAAERYGLRALARRLREATSLEQLGNA
ncbi:MAG: 5'-3' exonuclease H3TH domain-containing protein [Solirubrobacteraceae bacterium]